MRLRSFLKHGVVCGLLIATVCGTALAKKGDNGGRGGDGGGGGGGGGRSSHSSGSSSGSRSFSGGGGGGGGGGSSHSSGKSFSSKSFGGSGSGSGGSNSGSSMSRSFQGKSFSSGNGGGGNSGGSMSNKSSNGNSSLRRSSGGEVSPSGGQILQQSYNNSSDGKKWNGGSNNSNGGRANFRPSTRGELQGNQGQNGGNNAIGSNTNQGSQNFAPRKLSDNNGSGGSNQANGLGSSDSSNNSPKWSNNGGKGGSQPDFSRRNITSAKPTSDQVQNFLNLPKENREAMRDSNNSSDGSRKWAGRGGKDSNGQGLDNGSDSGNKTFRFNNDQLGNNGKNDPKWSGKLGNNNDNNGPGNGPGNKDGKLSGKFGDNKNGDGKWRGGRDGDFTGNRGGIPGVGGQNGVGTSIVDKHKDWGGKKGDWQVGDRKQGDHRDLSGKWNDGHRFDVAKDIRHQWKDKHDDHDGHDRPFHGDWWDNHHDRHHWHGNDWCWGVFGNWHNYRPYYWWDWCSAPRLNTYFSFGWNTPYYWDYGPGEYIYCADNVIYVNGRWFAPAPVYYQQTQVLAQRVPDWTPEQAAQVDWLPLGVFAVTRDGVADNNLVVQLAVTNEGVIGGTAFNKAAGVTYAVQGTVDKQSQRAVWSYVDEKDARVTMETGIYNLTQPECTALAHYSPQNIQVIQLVRLEQPAGEDIPQPAAAVAPGAVAPGTVIIPPQAN